MRALLIQNCQVEAPGLVGACLDRRGVRHETWHAYREPPPPDVGDYDTVIVFGAPASCREIDRHPRLLAVRDVVAACVARDQSVLGICFGGQLLARVLGAEVRRNADPEIGACQVELTGAGTRSPLFAGFPERFPVAQWHHDTFAVPAGATLLATGIRCRDQAFSIGNSAALQFHLELSPNKARQWIVEYADELATVDKTADQVLAEFVAIEADLADHCDRFIGNFLIAVAAHSGPSMPVGEGATRSHSENRPI